MLSSSDISDLFLNLEGKEPDDTLNIIYNASEVSTTEWKTVEEIIQKQESGIELWEIEEKVLNNFLKNYISAVNKKLKSVKEADLIGLTNTIADIRKKAPTELIGVANKLIDKHINTNRAKNMAPNSHRTVRNKLEEAFNKKTSVEDYYKNRY